MGAGWLPKRKETAWNAGMHSHTKCLNKLAVNEAGNGKERETSIGSAGGEVDHPGGESHRNGIRVADSSFLTNKAELVQK